MLLVVRKVAAYENLGGSVATFLDWSKLSKATLVESLAIRDQTTQCWSQPEPVQSTLSINPAQQELHS